MAETIATSDSISCIALFCRSMGTALQESAGIGLTHYRVVSYLGQRNDGAFPGAMADLLGVSAPTMSLCLGKLQEMEAVYCDGAQIGAARRRYRLSESGTRLLSRCDGAVKLACDDFFSVLDDELRAALLSGSLVTSSYLGLTRMEGTKYLSEYSVIEGFFNTELYSIKCAQAEGLSFGEFRVLLLLAEHPSLNTHAKMREHLQAHKSEVSSWCTSLARKGLVRAERDPLDGRSRLFFAEAEGLQAISRIKEAHDMNKVRPTERNEISLYSGMFGVIMDDLRSRG